MVLSEGGRKEQGRCTLGGRRPAGARHEANSHRCTTMEACRKMIVFVVALTPLLVGMILILFIARFSPNVPRVAPLRAGQKIDDRPEITADEFADVIKELLEALGL